MNQTLLPTDALTWRKIRVAAMVLMLVLPTLLHAGSYSAMSFLYPSPRRLLLLGLIGYQVFRIVQPESKKPRTVELWNSNLAIEITSLVLAMMFGLTYQRFVGISIMLPPAAAQAVFGALDLLSALAMLSPATRTVIDGEAQTFTVTSLFPRTYAFSAVPGLGVIEVRLMRGGSSVGKHHFIGLFTGSGEPTKLLATTEAEIGAQLGAITHHTGAPAARGAG